MSTREHSASRQVLRALFDAALAAADPMHAVAAHLPEPVAGRTLVLGAGTNSIRFSPPLVLTTAQADTALGILDAAISAVTKNN